MRFRLLFIILLLNIACTISKATAQNDYQPTWESINSRPVPQWFEDAKFGIFIHWGVYAVPAWAPTNPDISIYAKYSEWYWWRKNEDNETGKLFRDYHDKMYGKDFKYQDFASMCKAQN